MVRRPQKSALQDAIAFLAARARKPDRVKPSRSAYRSILIEHIRWYRHVDADAFDFDSRRSDQDCDAILVFDVRTRLTPTQSPS
jgi:hypothetical protein